MYDVTMSPDELKRARGALNISQAGLAAALGLSRPTIARLELGILPIKAVVALAVEYLVILHSDGPPSKGSS